MSFGPYPSACHLPVDSNGQAAPSPGTIRGLPVPLPLSHAISIVHHALLGVATYDLNHRCFLISDTDARFTRPAPHPDDFYRWLPYVHVQDSRFPPSPFFSNFSPYTSQPEDRHLLPRSYQTDLSLISL